MCTAHRVDGSNQGIGHALLQRPHLVIPVQLPSPAAHLHQWVRALGRANRRIDVDSVVRIGFALSKGSLIFGEAGSEFLDRPTEPCCGRDELIVLKKKVMCYRSACQILRHGVCDQVWRITYGGWGRCGPTPLTLNIVDFEGAAW